MGGMLLYALLLSSLLVLPLLRHLRLRVKLALCVPSIGRRIAAVVVHRNLQHDCCHHTYQ